MHSSAVLIILITLAAAVRSKRANIKKALLGDEDILAVPEIKDVDFDFMTKDYRWPGHKAGFFGSITEFFGSRAVSEVKEEIVAGHACQNRGQRDETYYASSFCYWLPQFVHPESRKKHSGLLWTGGRYPNGKSLGNMLSGSGKCLKLSVCHNNARDGGDVDKHAFAEEIHLPDGCIKEKQIEQHCVNNYDTASATLKLRNDDCAGVQRTYDTAMRNYDQCAAFLQSLPQEISQYPARIRSAEDDVIRLRARLESAEQSERRERDQMRRRCDDYERLKGWNHFSNWALGATSSEMMLSSFSTHCSYPHRPFDNHNGSHIDEMMRYNQNSRLYDACQECDRARNDLRRANSDTSKRSQDLRRGQQRVPQLQSERRAKENSLRDWQHREPILRQAKNEESNIWLPQRDSCLQTYQEYKTGKVNAVASCAPEFYPRSCERACVELQSKDGCGIVEGSFPGDASGMGGVTVQCVPPQPSWILAPFTYGQHEDTADQCKRIEATQKVQYSNGILKAGWLWKKGGSAIDLNGRWDKRYFVLESANAVRSAVLRYWNHDPTKSAEAEENAAKGIILHDAKRVKEKSGTGYGFKNGEECFKVYHFYRDYRFCVVVDEEDPKFSSWEERDEWLHLVGKYVGGD